MLHTLWKLLPRTHMNRNQSWFIPSFHPLWKFLMSINQIFENRVGLNVIVIDNCFSCNLKGTVIIIINRQGDNLAPTLFTLYINDLIPVINELDVGVSICDSKVSILLYADDIVLLSDSPYGVQQQLNILKDWLKTWHMKANVDKTKIVQFRPRTTRQSIAIFL